MAVSSGANLQPGAGCDGRRVDGQLRPGGGGDGGGERHQERHRERQGHLRVRLSRLLLTGGGTYVCRA